MATYTEAVNKFTKAATEIMEYARLLTDARGMFTCYTKRKTSFSACREKSIRSNSLFLYLPRTRMKSQMAKDRRPRLITDEGFDFVSPLYRLSNRSLADTVTNATGGE